MLFCELTHILCIRGEYDDSASGLREEIKLELSTPYLKNDTLTMGPPIDNS